jgi:hypothetical protein
MIPCLAGRSSFVLLALALAAPTLACSSRPAAQSGTTTAAKEVPAGATTIMSFAVSNENLNVDRVGLRDGFLKPDGNRDLAFAATISGPYEALFVVSTNAKGEPGYGLRADTLTGTDEIPTELGGVIDTGKMTVGIGVVESGKFTNGESGSAHGGPGLHNLTLYIPNTATLQAGSHVRLYLRIPGGALVPGPITPY